ncbi:9674_t:CDS:2 [Acaulospora morrowiae]|uniref:9674_t:CDS:1 n=1 Tax=Acaulospora morrowiae TaxID=94023 RepID=A0A9N8W1Z3_9GLOM|nr:9674_t:CDS:2 [Acaulospora morrowiae]
MKQTPSEKNLDCGDSRKRGHNTEDCPKKDKFSQGSSGTEGMQLDENGELGHSSKDSYTANPEERYISIEENKSVTNHEQQEERRERRLQQHPCRNTKHLEKITTSHPSKDLEECPDNDEILTMEDKRNNNVNEGEGNIGGCLEEKTILMRADPATKKSDQPSRIIMIREEDTPLCKRNSLTINLILKTLGIQ